MNLYDSKGSVWNVEVGKRFVLRGLQSDFEVVFVDHKGRVKFRRVHPITGALETGTPFTVDFCDLNVDGASI